ncbi:C2H2-type zinc finger protein [Amycolatopsis sp. CA-126428]|uniref:C2H2-type zinc finger protein n=1 Tax=Amycolatopsis sp. CA-126428 TaxID=2073158 RepID=UPI000CD2CBD6|nr:C2H2-type zinc finger protein [Amycolatopsis sp. CA-126428]
MTATEVDGVAVVSDEPREAPFRDNGGNTIYQPQTRVLTLANGTVVYGCQHCDYTSPNPNSIRPHLGKHTGRTRKSTATPSARDSLNLPLAELMARLDTLTAVTEDRDAWRTRALKAEKKLRQARNALVVIK